MAIKLRTRLFLVVAILLGASILASALLSRRATLVEVRELTKRDLLNDQTGALLDEVEETVSRHTSGGVPGVLAAVEARTAHPVVLFDGSGSLVSASNPALSAARVRRATPDGTFLADITFGGSQSTIAIHGAPTREISNGDGSRMWAMVLPPLREGRPSAPGGGVPGWLLATLATGLIAFPLVFAVSRRILGPITAITAAARRMQGGHLDVRVEDRGTDELGDLARAFNAMAGRLAENERLRKQMVSDVAHELRSPVTNLRCTLEAIQDGLLTAERANIDALHDETLYLQRIIADLQDLALADAGQLALDRRPVQVEEVLRRAVAATQNLSSGAPIVLSAAADLPAIDADPNRLEQVFRNLLSNARTHTPTSGRIEVDARAVDGGLAVTVADTGSGIGSEHLPHVFDRFYRVDRSRTRATGGAGLGLAIARQLIRSHGGTIEAASAGPGEGSAFTVRLPSAARPQPGDAR